MIHILLTLQQCTTERDALYDIYKENGGLNDQWNTNNWFTANEEEEEIYYCQFTGVTCDYQTNSHVTYLNLDNFNLGGQISSQLLCLTYLKSLYLNNQNHYVTLPDITQLQNLQYLQANSAGLEGQIPDFCSMPNLLYLYVSNNYLTGQLPQCTDKQIKESHLTEFHTDCDEYLEEQEIPSNYKNLIWFREMRTQCVEQINCESQLSTKSNFVFECGLLFDECDNCLQYEIIEFIECCPAILYTQYCEIGYYQLTQDEVMIINKFREVKNMLLNEE